MPPGVDWAVPPQEGVPVRRGAEGELAQGSLALGELAVVRVEVQMGGLAAGAVVFLAAKWLGRLEAVGA